MLRRSRLCLQEIQGVVNASVHMSFHVFQHEVGGSDVVAGASQKGGKALMAGTGPVLAGLYQCRLVHLCVSCEGAELQAVGAGFWNVWNHVLAHPRMAHYLRLRA